MNDDRLLPPHSEEAERSVIGAVLEYPEFYPRVAFLQPEDFFIIRHDWLWRAIQTLYRRQEAIHFMSVYEELDSQQQDELGGTLYMTDIMRNVLDAYYYAETFARIVQRCAIRRKMEDVANTLYRLSRQESGDIDEILGEAQAAFFDLLAHQTQDDTASAAEIGLDVARQIEDAYAAHQRGEVVGAPTGFTELDQMIGGLHKSRVYTVAGRPGMGKTGLILSMMLKLARAKVPTLLFSLEMDREETVKRLVAMETGVSSHDLENGTIDQRELARSLEAVERIRALPFWVNHRGGISIADIQAQTERYYLEYGVRVVFVDYLQLATGDQDRQNRTLEVGSISRGLKTLAKKHKISVVSAAQLNRNVEGRQDKRPQLADLRESGDIEQDSDVVMFLYRDDYYNENTEKPNVTEIRIAKQRNGPTGTFELYWRPELTQFADVIARERVDLSGY